VESDSKPQAAGAAQGKTGEKAEHRY